jgi:hypothetical protein
MPHDARTQSGGRAGAIPKVAQETNWFGVHAPSFSGA